MTTPKTKLLIFEGIDKVGKTTLIQAVHKKTDFKYLCIDRFAATSFAYGKLRGRDIDYGEFYQGMYNVLIMFDVKLFWVQAKEKIWWDRMKSHGETSLVKEERNVLLKYFRQFFGSVKRNSSLKVNIVDTTVKSIDECADDIVKVIESK